MNNLDENNKATPAAAGLPAVAPAKAGTSVRKVAKNAFFNSGAWVVNVLVTLAATPILVKKLGVEGYGIYALLTSLVGYYGLLDLGLGQGVVKFVSEAKANNDEAGLNKSINTALFVQILLGIVGSLLLVVFASPLLHLLKVSPAFWNDALAGLYACTAGFFLTMISRTLSSALMGLQRYDLTSKVNVVMNIVLTATMTILALLGHGLRDIIYVNVLCSAITMSIFYFIVKSELPGWKLSAFSFERIFFGEMFNFSGYMFVSKLSSLFSNYIVRFIISAILGPAALTFFVIPMKVITALGGFLNNIAIVLFPFASEMNAVDQRERLLNVYIKASKYLVTLSFPAYLLLSVFSKEILKMWMGAEFAAHGWVVMSILSAAYLISALTMVPSNITFGLGYSKVIALFSTIELIGGVIIIPLFARYFGIIGAATGFLILQVLMAPCFTFYATKKIIGYSIIGFLKQVVSFHIAGFLCAMALFYLFKLFAKDISSIIVLSFFTLFIIAYYSGSVFFKWIDINDLKKIRRKKNKF